MSAAEKLITDHLDTWTSAIQTKKTAGRGKSKGSENYGIKKLRELILELAVRGKLVPQDPNDEPANKLLERIVEEKQRLVEEGKIKKQKPLLAISEEEQPFDLPQSWKWARMQEVCGYIQRGKGPKYSDIGSTKVVSQKCIQWSGFDLSLARFVDELSLEKYQFERFLCDGDLLWNSTGTGTVGRVNVLNSPCVEALVADSHVTVIRPEIVDSNYLWCYLASPGIQARINPDHEDSLVSGTTKQVELNTSSVIALAVPIPSLEEQHRIVAKVDELMALCDRLERQQEASITAHKTLVQTLLDALATASERDGFTAAWARIADHFDTLFTTEWSIDQLKQTILQLAVMGKLVPQCVNDESASEFLKRIAEDKAQLIKNGKIKKQSVPQPIDEGDKPYRLPKNWEWCRLPDVGELARGKSKHRPRNDPALYSNGSVPLVQTGDVSRAENVIQTNTALYNEAGVAQSRLWPKGTLCITIAANIADTAVLGFDACFPDSIVGFTPIDKTISVRYFDYFIRTAKNHLEDYAPSTAQKNINLEILGKLSVPLPPPQELNKIVAKVDELMALCDSLKARIKKYQSTQNLFADAVVERAITQ